jgi:hypothetical protein
MQRLFFVLAGWAGLFLATTGFAGVEADPTKDYSVTPEVGPWMVYATHYEGPEAVSLAHQMVLEIRSRFNLPAYVFNRADEERKKQREEILQLQQQHPDWPEALLRRRMPRIQEQCAVLIGGYRSMDDAHYALKQVRNLPPPTSEKLMPILIEGGRGGEGHENQDLVKYAYANPFLNSFVARNPTVPREATAAKQEDPNYRRLNAGEDYSLLNCRKPWTLVVATYQGAHVIKDSAASGSFLERLWGGSGGEVLAASGQNAHNLAEALHKLGYDAYVLHTRWGSVVTVGGFDRADDPRMDEIRQSLKTRMQFNSQGTQKVMPLPILSNPLPMEVPRT